VRPRTTTADETAAVFQRQAGLRAGRLEDVVKVRLLNRGDMEPITGYLSLPEAKENIEFARRSGCIPIEDRIDSEQ
jgi:hypothetical protein